MRRLFGKIVLPLLLAVALCMAPVSAAPDANKDKENTDSAPIKKQVLSADFETVLENDKYRFSIKTEDGNIAVTDKKSGIIRYANPINAQDDELAIGGKGEVLKSQILVQYYENDSIVVNNSYADAAKNNNISYSVENDVLYVNYLMGDDEFDTNLIPMILTKERMEKDILSKLSKDEKEEILDRFRLYERKELDPEALKGMEITYPSLKKYDIYVRGAIPAFKAKDFYELFVKAGYTVEDLQKDYDQNELENPYKPKPSFDITLEYSLTDDGFKVDVDPKKIKYVENFKPVRIDILPYFDAADSKDSGFIFVPDGSGSLINLKIENMRDQHEKAKHDAKQAKKAPKKSSSNKESYTPVEPTKHYGFVSVCAGDGLADLFKDLGVDTIVSGGQTMNPSTDDILKAVETTPAKTVFVLPNNKNIIMAAEQVIPISTRKVIVLHTRTIPQGITAMLNFDPDLKSQANAVAMQRAAEKIATGQITFAARDSEFDGHRIKKGELMALLGGKITFVDTDLENTVMKLLKQMVKRDSQFITVIYGEDVTDEQAATIEAQIQEKYGSKAEIMVINGGQPIYYYIISVE